MSNSRDALLRQAYLKAFLKKGKLLAAHYFFKDIITIFKKKYPSLPGLDVFLQCTHKIYPEFNQKKLTLGGFLILYLLT